MEDFKNQILRTASWQTKIWSYACFLFAAGNAALVGTYANRLTRHFDTWSVVWIVFFTAFVFFWVIMGKKFRVLSDKYKNEIEE